MSQMRIDRMLAEFSGREFEDAYRADRLATDIKTNRLVLGVVSIAPAFFAISDAVYFRDSPSFVVLETLRGIILSGAVLLIALLPKARKAVYVDISVVLWLLVTSSIFIYINASRPSGFIIYRLSDVMVIMSIYLLFEIRPVLRLVPAVFFTGASLVLIFSTAEQLAPAEYVGVVFAYAFPNVCGLAFTWSMQAGRRREFQNARQLEQAREHIITLRGMLPICASCKKIRDDDGFWTQIESYISDHSEAEFTHSLCPECLATFSNKSR